MTGVREFEELRCGCRVHRLTGEMMNPCANYPHPLDDEGVRVENVPKDKMADRWAPTVTVEYGVRVENERSAERYTRMDWREPREPMLLVYDEASDTPAEAYMCVDTMVKAEIIYPEGWTRVELARNQFIRIKPGKPHLRLHVKLGKFSKEPLWWVREFCRTPHGNEAKYYKCADAIGVARSRFKIYGHV